MTRFAPAPTGHLHLGHVVNAIYVWGLGAALGSRVILRIEDHDRQRSRPEYETDLLDDLDWLGFRPDLYPTAVFRAGPCESRQSDREAIYHDVAGRLTKRGLVYGCTCSRQDWARTRAATDSRMAHCPGRCRERGISPEDGRAWRVCLDQQPVPPIDDLLLGPDLSMPAGHEDPVIRDRKGNWTYQFAVVVDDFRQGVDLVIRGQDLASSTVLQVRLGQLIGRPTPARFAHHPLVMKSATEKLSKSDGDTGVRALRDAGWSADRVIGHAADLVNLAPEGRPLPAATVRQLFSL